MALFRTVAASLLITDDGRRGVQAFLSKEVVHFEGR